MADKSVEEFVMNPQFIGRFEITFRDKEFLQVIDFKEPLVDYHGHPICLVGTDGAFYNWSNVIKMKRV